MKLVFLYGPPGVGKLTIAKELSKLTGYRIFHNHLTSDVVRSIFPRETKDKEAEALVHKYRLELMELAAAKNVNLIFTFFYIKPFDDWFLKKVVQQVKKHKGQIFFVQIVCSEKELLKRIKSPSRKRSLKLKKSKDLRGLIQQHDIFSAVPYANNFLIDNTNLSPKRAAQRIKRHFRL